MTIPLDARHYNLGRLVWWSSPITVLSNFAVAISGCCRYGLWQSALGRAYVSSLVSCSTSWAAATGHKERSSARRPIVGARFSVRDLEVGGRGGGRGIVVQLRHLSTAKADTEVEAAPSSEWWLYWVLAGSVAAIAAVTIATQAPLSYDGRAYLIRIFDRTTAYVPYHRYANWLEQWPAVLAAKSGDFEVTRVAFSVAYAITPVALFAIAAAWIWRSARRYLPILVVGMLVSTFVAQTFYVSESVTSVQIWWCAWAAFVPRERSTLRNVVGTLFAIAAIFMYVPAIALVAVL